MDNKQRKIAEDANLSAYEEMDSYIDGAPHIKHKRLRDMYGRMLIHLVCEAKKNGGVPYVLELGAGEGSTTLPLLELGARVMAVDISQNQLDGLVNKCHIYGEMLETKCADAFHYLNGSNQRFDIIIANSFLHHIPDYVSLVDSMVGALNQSGQIFTFQDPLHHDSMKMKDLLFSDISYFCWRIFKKDVLGGFGRWLRRRRGLYKDDVVEDNVEYHAVRKGVDQRAICQRLNQMNIDCKIFPYFSTQNAGFNWLGTHLKIKNTFAIIATKTATTDNFIHKAD